MSRVVRKKRPKHINMDWSQNRTKNMFFINLDKYTICRAASSHGAEQLFKLDRWLAIEL